MKFWDINPKAFYHSCVVAGDPQNTLADGGHLHSRRENYVVGADVVVVGAAVVREDGVVAVDGVVVGLEVDGGEVEVEGEAAVEVGLARRVGLEDPNERLRQLLRLQCELLTCSPCHLIAG